MKKILDTLDFNALNFNTKMSNEQLTEWEDRRREYMGSAIALMLAISSASLAFCGSLLVDNEISFGGCKTFAFLIAAGGFSFTLIFSLAASFTRLQDARRTADTVRERQKTNREDVGKK